MLVEHVNLTVSDLDRSVDFYRRLFNVEVRWQGVLTSGRRAAHVGNDSQYIALFEAPEPGRATTDMQAVGLNHFGTVVESLELMKGATGRAGLSPPLRASLRPRNAPLRLRPRRDRDRTRAVRR